MKLRDTVLALIAFCAAAAPFAGFAQQPEKMFRIGWLSSQPPATPGTAYRGGAFVKRLSELGYIEGKHYEFVVRLGNGDTGKLPALADELVRAKVDVIVASGDLAADAVRDKRIPVVATTCQPFEAVSKLARDGLNLTGITCMTMELAPKRFELFKQVVPRARRLAVLHTPNQRYGGLEILHEQAKVFGLVLEPIAVPDAAALEGALASIARNRPDGITHQPSQVLAREFQRMADFALKEKLPMVGPFSELAKFGGLITYGAAGPELPNTAADQTARIFKGAMAREMPIEQARNIVLTINLKTAKALGITIPQSLLVRADEVIQ